MITEHAYAELGLPTGASEQQVKAAWRRLMSQWHPDRNPSAAAVAKVQRINQAFEAIRSGRHQPAPVEEPPEPPAAEPQEPAPPAAEADDQPRRAPIRRKLKLTLEEAAAGCIKPLRGKFSAACSDCDGAGHQVLGGNCTSCGGSGAVKQRSAWFGWPSVSIECEACLGGGIARRTCPTCGGSGKCEHSYQVQVRIPAGVRDGDLLHVAARRAPADLEVQVQLAPHALFALQDDGTLLCRVPVDGFAWMANRSVRVPLLDGVQSLGLRRDQQRYILPGQGFPVRHRGPRGDLAIEIEPLFPERLSGDQEILLDQLIAGSAGSDPRLAQWQRDLRARERKRPPPG